jgi:RNA-directed DNA polymerase
MGKPAATDRRCLPSLSHSFTLDLVVLCNGTKAQALDMKEELKDILDHMGLKLSEEKTKVTHITEGFKFLGRVDEFQISLTKSIGFRKRAISINSR